MRSEALDEPFHVLPTAMPAKITSAGSGVSM
jgi:hypothetical protein